MTTVKKSDIDTFVRSVAGKHLSIRDIDILANGYFKGSDELREQIRTGHISFGLKQLKMTSTAMSDREKRLLTTLEIILRYMQRFLSQSNEGRSNHFMAQANLLSGRIIQQLDAFSRETKLFHDRTGQT